MPHCYGNSRAIWDQFHTEVTMLPLAQPIKADTRFSNPRGMKAELT